MSIIETKKSANYQNGELHNDNGPAVIYASGTQKWYRNGQLYKEGVTITKLSYKQYSSEHLNFNGKIYYREIIKELTGCDF